MEQNDLINEIVARVAAKMALLDSEKSVSNEVSFPVTDNRPGLLILTQEHRDFCHSVYNSGCLAEHYKIGCALMQNYEVNMDDYEAVVLFGLSNQALGKLAAGICDTPYTMIAEKAFLSGKRIYVPKEQVELFRYAKTAPKPYYTMLEDKLALLTASGLVITKMEDLEQCLLDEQVSNCGNQRTHHDPKAEYHLHKRVITERDLIEAGATQTADVYIPVKCIVTDLAKDYAHAHNISLIQEATTS